MSFRQQDQSFSYYVHFLNFMPTQAQIKLIDKNTRLFIVINKQSITPMFISQFQNVATLNSTIKPFLYQGRISLDEHSLRFNIKLSDLNKNDTYFLKIFAITNGQQKQITYFKFFVNKYVQALKVQGKNYFEQNFFQKTGARVEAEVFVQKNRGLLQMLIADMKQVNRKKRSLNAKRKRQQSKSPEQIKTNKGNTLTIQNIYKQAVDEKNLRKTKERNQLAKTKRELKRKESNMSNLSLQSGWDEPPLSSVISSKKSDKKSDEKSQKSSQERKKLVSSRNVAQKHNNLDISRISEVVNSEFGSDLQKTNNFQSFSRQRNKLRRSQCVQKQTDTDHVLEHLDISQPNKGPTDVVSMIQEIQQQSSVVTRNKKIISEINFKESEGRHSSLTEFSQPQTQGLQRSFGGDAQAIDDDVSIIHSSELSARSQIKGLVQKKNKCLWTILFIISFIAMYYLMGPKSSLEYDNDDDNYKSKNNRKKKHKR